MNIDINLLKEKGDYYRVEAMFLVARRVTVIVGIVTVLSLGVVFVLRLNLKNTIVEHQDRKQQLESEIAQYGGKVDKIKLLGGKLIEIEKIKSTAPDFGSYYSVIEKFAPANPSEGVVKKLSFNSPNAVVMEMEFPDIIALTKFLATVESKEFIDSFDSIRLSNIIFARGDEDLTLTVHLIMKDEKT